MLSAMLGIVYVDIMEEFDSSASQVALMLSLYGGITFGGSKLEVHVFNKNACYLGTLTNCMLIELKIKFKIIIKNNNNVESRSRQKQIFTSSLHICFECMFFIQ